MIPVCGAPKVVTEGTSAATSRRQFYRPAICVDRLAPGEYVSSMRYLLTVLCLSLSWVYAQPSDRPRTVITTDGEIDDVDSFIRLLLYANELRIEGLVYSSSMWHYKGDGRGTTITSAMEMTRELYGERSELRWPGEQWMQELIGAYEQVYPVLSPHAEGYPTAEELLGLVKVGNITFEGEMTQDTEGSTFIRDLLLDTTNTAPIYLQAWGGTNTIARALKSIEDTYAGTPVWPDLYRRVSDKAIIYVIMDQDATLRDYIAGSWPEVAVLYNAGQFGVLAYPWQRMVPEEMQFWLEGRWMGPHIIQDHGPLLAAYYSYGDGQQQAGDPEHIHGDSTRLDSAQWGSFQPYDFISEGDSPAFLHLLDVGLDQLEHPEWGGWGGRLGYSDYNPFTRAPDPAYAQTRWIPALQRDFAARADWCVLPYDSANHPPSVALEGTNRLAVRPRQPVNLQVAATDPDGDDLYYHWWRYGEVDSYPGQFLLVQDGPRARLTVPYDMQPGQTIHLIVSVTDGGTPALTRYERVVLTATK